MQPFNRIRLSTALISVIFGSGVVAFSSVAFANTNSASRFAVSKVNPAAVSLTTALGESESVVANVCNPLVRPREIHVHHPLRGAARSGLPDAFA